MSGNIVQLTSFDMAPKFITAINAFDDAMCSAINAALEAGVHKGMIVGMLHAYAHQQTAEMVDSGYA